MKWYKHISDSLDDPFIFDLIDTFGADGYLVFFGILEIYSREFKTEDDWKLSVTHAYLRQKLHKRQDTLVIKILKHIQNSGKWNIVFENNQVIIFIPKFTELIDEWSRRKLSSHSVVTPKILNTDKDKEEDKDTTSSVVVCRNKVKVKYDDDFLCFYSAYPKHIGKEAAWKAWQKRNGDRPDLNTLLKKIESQKNTENWKKENGSFIPHPATWINNARWEDEVESKSQW